MVRVHVLRLGGLLRERLDVLLILQRLPQVVVHRTQVPDLVVVVYQAGALCAQFVNVLRKPKGPQEPRVCAEPGSVALATDSR